VKEIWPAANPSKSLADSETEIITAMNPHQGHKISKYLSEISKSSPFSDIYGFHVGASLLTVSLSAESLK